MKNLAIFSLVTFNFVFISLAYADGQLGDVVYSYLKEDKFTELHGRGWVSFGPEKDIRSSDLCRFANICYLNDNQGNFFRVPGWKANPVGKQQYSGTALPTNAFEITTEKSGSHKHTIRYFVGGPQEGESASTAGGGCWPWKGGRGYTEIEGEHDHTCTIKGGDDETRPCNISLYTYIKINNDEGGKLEREEKEKQNQFNLSWQNAYSTIQKSLDSMKLSIQSLMQRMR